MSLLDWFEHIPDTLMPWLTKENHFVLYEAWREVCHLVGAFFLIFLYIKIRYFSKALVIIFFILFVLWMTYQEFHLHPIKYHQPLWKGILDWLVWIVPQSIYIYYSSINKKKKQHY